MIVGTHKQVLPPTAIMLLQSVMAERDDNRLLVLVVD